MTSEPPPQAPRHVDAKDAAAQEAELRQKAKAECERALDAAEPDDIERLPLGLDAAQLLLQLQPSPWQSYAFMPPPSHGNPYGYAGEGINFIATQVATQVPPPIHDFGLPISVRCHVPPPFDTMNDNDYGPPPPTWDDFLASGQAVTQEDLNLTSDEPSDWLLVADDDGHGQ